MLSDTSVTDNRVFYGSTLVFEDIPSGSAPLRVSPCEDSLVRVIGGLIRLSTDDSERLLGPGDEAIVPAGVCHRLASLSGMGRTVTGFRPPLSAHDDRLPWS